jgi:hypothetical protein
VVDRTAVEIKFKSSKTQLALNGNSQINMLHHYYRRLNCLVSLPRDLWFGTNLAFRLPWFIRNPLDFENAKHSVNKRLMQRDDNFLTIAKNLIYHRQENPYRMLLNLIGCEYGDLESLVNNDGVESALQVLFQQGVYLTVDEFKGRSPVVRGSFKMEVHPGLFRNPLSSSHLFAQTSGSRGAPTTVYVDLAKMKGDAAHRRLALQPRSDGQRQVAVWQGPEGPDLKLLLIFSCMGDPPIRWFVRAGDPALQNRSWRWRTQLLRFGCLAGGIRIPKPKYVPHDDPLPIARWMAEVLGAGKVPYLNAVASSAVRLCEAAFGSGIDLSGAKFMLNGEPTTEARLAVLKRIGAEGIPDYGTNETGSIGYGCMSPEAPDDVHLFHDSFALIQPESANKNIPSNALFITALETKAPFLMLNVSTGDQAIITKRKCGCPLQRFGWDTHLHSIRSYEKLTTGGLTLLDSDLIRVLEEVLPAKFGGGPSDYQLLEEEEEGQPCLTLLVNPKIGSVETNKVAEAFLTGIGAGSNRLWRTPGFFRVVIQAPLLGSSGKIQHLHVERRRI